jgi:hypothetical protein
LGRLEVKDQIFESELEALAYARGFRGADTIKVFGHDDTVKHEITANNQPDTYA